MTASNNQETRRPVCRKLRVKYTTYVSLFSDSHIDRVVKAPADWELPRRVQEHLANLETLLARDQVGRGKEILASLGTEILISADGTAEVRGDLRKALTLLSSRKDSAVLWSGERESNPHPRLGRPKLYH